jgi:hypothetical protein
VDRRDEMTDRMISVQAQKTMDGSVGAWIGGWNSRQAGGYAGRSVGGLVDWQAGRQAG